VQGHCAELLALMDAQRAATDAARHAAATATAEARQLATRDGAWAQQQRSWQRERDDLLARLDGVAAGNFLGGFRSGTHCGHRLGGSVAGFSKGERSTRQPLAAADLAGAAAGCAENRDGKEN
jgi:hypothetical protein